MSLNHLLSPFDLGQGYIPSDLGKSSRRPFSIVSIRKTSGSPWNRPAHNALRLVSLRKDNYTSLFLWSDNRKDKCINELQG